MGVKSYHEAQNAIKDIVNNAKIPASAMVAILETTKLALVDTVFKESEQRQAARFFDKVRDEMSKEDEQPGVH